MREQARGYTGLVALNDASRTGRAMFVPSSRPLWGRIEREMWRDVATFSRWHRMRLQLRRMTVRPVPVDDVIDLRHRVLRAGLPREAASFPGDDEPTAVHFAAIEGSTVVGCVTLIHRPHDGAPAWQLRGMAVAPERRGGGVGSALLAAVDAHVGASDFSRQLWCNARVPAVGFYARHGWRAVNDVFDIPTAGPHRAMVKRIG
jgi:GNAT superfamily N-acetyltransferase